MGELRKTLETTVLTASLVLAMGAAACSAKRQQGGDAGSPTGNTAIPSPLHAVCMTLPVVGEPVGRSKDEGPWLYAMPEDPECSTPVYNPYSLETIAFLEPAMPFFVDCIYKDEPLRLRAILTGDRLGPRGDVNLNSQSAAQFVGGQYKPEECRVPATTPA